MEHILVSSAGLYSLLLSSIPSPAASRGKEEGNPEFDNPKVDGHPTGAASHGMGFSPGNSEVSGLLVCSTAALTSPSRTQLYVNLSFTKDYRNPP